MLQDLITHDLFVLYVNNKRNNRVLSLNTGFHHSQFCFLYVINKRNKQVLSLNNILIHIK